MLIDNDDIEKLCDILRRVGKKIVFTNGCFDIVHSGHVRYLEQARKLGDFLVLGLNSDDSVRRLKGNARPVNTQFDRAEVIGGLRSVDCVVIFGEDTAETLISRIKPDVYVKGGDYDLSSLPEAKIVQSYGGRVEFIELVQGKSTTNIIRRISDI